MKNTIAYWKQKVWKEVFAPYIKKRDCLRTTGSPEYGECFTCDYSGHVSTLQAGHFIPQRHNAYLFSEEGVHAQCARCNGLRQGCQYEYGKHLDELYGKGTADRLIEESKQIKKFTVAELKELYETYKQKIRELDD